MPRERTLQTHYLHAQLVFNSVLCGQHGIDSVQYLGVKIPFTAFAANLGVNIFDDIQPSIQPMLASRLHVSKKALTRYQKLADETPAPRCPD